MNSYSNWYKQKCKQHHETIDVKFVNWVNNVETIVFNVMFVTLLDLPDEMYRINFENGVSPKNMAQIVINNNSISCS